MQGRTKPRRTPRAAIAGLITVVIEAGGVGDAVLGYRSVAPSPALGLNSVTG